jgi:Uma2 family endonuclease
VSAAQEEPAWTLPDLLALPDDGLVHELLWGQIVMNPVPSARHADYVDDLAEALRAVCPSDLRVRTHSGIVIPGTPVINAPGADLYLAPRTALADPYISAGDVSLVIDVSLSTFQRDRGAKAAAYAAGKIGWYWVVHRDRSIHVHRLDPNGDYEVAQVVRPGAAVQVLGPEALDFTFDPATLGH